MDKQPHGLLASLSPAVRKQVERELLKLRSELFKADLEGYFASQRFRKALNRFMYGNKYQESEAQ